jgi:hypothetical protein
MELDRFAAQYVLNRIPADHLKGLAMDFVSVGIDSASFVSLAGAMPCDHPADLRALFVAGLRERGVALPSRGDAAMTLIKQLCREIADERIPADLGAREIVNIYYEVSQELDARYLDDCLSIVALNDSLGQFTPDSPDCLTFELEIVKECARVFANIRDE